MYFLLYFYNFLDMISLFSDVLYEKYIKLEWIRVKIKEDNKNELCEMDIFLGMQQKRPKRISAYIHINFLN